MLPHAGTTTTLEGSSLTGQNYVTQMGIIRHQEIVLSFLQSLIQCGPISAYSNWFLQVMQHPVFFPKYLNIKVFSFWLGGWLLYLRMFFTSSFGRPCSTTYFASSTPTTYSAFSTPTNCGSSTTASTFQSCTKIQTTWWLLPKLLFRLCLFFLFLDPNEDFETFVQNCDKRYINQGRYERQQNYLTTTTLMQMKRTGGELSLQKILR